MDGFEFYTNGTHLIVSHENAVINGVPYRFRYNFDLLSEKPLVNSVSFRSLDRADEKRWTVLPTEAARRKAVTLALEAAEDWVASNSEKIAEAQKEYRAEKIARARASIDSCEEEIERLRNLIAEGFYMPLTDLRDRSAEFYLSFNR